MPRSELHDQRERIELDRAFCFRNRAIKLAASSSTEVQASGGPSRNSDLTESRAPVR